MASSVAQVLVVDDEPDLRTLYELTLVREGYHVDTVGTLAEGWQQLEDRRFDVVITDMRLPDGMGLELLQRMQAQQRAERCIVMTAYGSAENAVEALKAGAFDYLTKPVDLKQFRSVVASALHEREAPPPRVRSAGSAGNGAKAATAGKPEPAGGAGQAALDRLVGDSAPMQRVKERIARVSRSMAPVLVRGESGTGKELAARALHACSHRSEGPFVAVNCGAIPEALLEAEFFGARKGSYTGSTADRQGYFQAAQGGTLFLDEIGDLPLAMQSKLLRAIQERHVRAIGSTQEDAVDVRIVSATHRDLGADVAAGRFRQDLFYRLNVIEIVLPPLRERREDLPALCEALLARIAHDSGMPLPLLSAAGAGRTRDASAGGQRARTREPAASRGGAVRWPGPAGRRHRRASATPAPLRGAGVRTSPAGVLAGGVTGGDGAVGPAGLSRPAGARDPRSHPAGDRLQPHRGRAAAGPEPAADPLPHRAAGHRGARRRRSQ